MHGGANGSHFLLHMPHKCDPYMLKVWHITIHTKWPIHLLLTYRYVLFAPQDKAILHAFHCLWMAWIWKWQFSWWLFDSNHNNRTHPKCNLCIMELHAYHTTYMSQGTWDSRKWVKKFDIHHWFQSFLQVTCKKNCQNSNDSPWYTKGTNWTFNHL